jgi:hypothetical protein
MRERSISEEACMARCGGDGGHCLPDVEPAIALAHAMRIATKHRALIHVRRLRMRNEILASLLTLSFLLLSTASSWSQVACKPLLSVKSVRDAHVSSLPIVPRRWSATILSDASFCATRSGSFEMDFIRTKENSPDLQYTQRFRWNQNEFDVSMEMTSDEAVHEFRIGFIAPCPCREIDRLSSARRVK